MKLFYNGMIYTMNADNSIADAMIVEGDRVAAVGTRKDMEALDVKEAEKIDLQGKTVLPGLCDCHVHLKILGETQNNLELHGKSKQEIIDMVAEKAKSMPPGEWILGMGWNQENWEEDSFPTRVDLDPVTPDNPVRLTRYCGHAYWCNSKALSLAGIEKPSDEVGQMGAEHFTDKEGRLTGTLVGESCEILDRAVPSGDEKSDEQNYLLAQEYLLKNGITAIMEKGAGAESALMADCGRQAVRSLENLYKRQEMKLRIHESIVGIDEYFDDCFAEGPRKDMYGDRLTIGGIKLWADGAFGARTAYISEDYKDRPGERGNRKFTDDELIALFRKADEKGLQIAVHAIGDACCAQILDCYEKAFKDSPEKDRRFIIDHFHAPKTSDIDRMIKNKIILSTQFIQFATDVDMLGDIIPQSMMENLYPWRQVIEKGGTMCNGSDTPVDSAEPFKALYVAVTRCNLNGKNNLEKPPLQPLTRIEALRAYTTEAAYARCEEDNAGSLEKGKLADFIVIDRDYFRCPVEEIKEIKVLQTFLGGEKVYQN